MKRGARFSGLLGRRRLDASDDEFTLADVGERIAAYAALEPSAAWPVERRSGADRRSQIARRQRVSTRTSWSERRSGVDRRSLTDRRSLLGSLYRRIRQNEFSP